MALVGRGLSRKSAGEVDYDHTHPGKTPVGKQREVRHRRRAGAVQYHRKAKEVDGQLTPLRDMPDNNLPDQF